MKIGVPGVAGRMGRELIREIAAHPACVLAGATVTRGHAWVGKDAGITAGGEKLGVRISDDPVALFGGTDVIIDFTTPESTVEFAALAAETRTAHVIGTTGLSLEQEAAVREYAARTPIVHAPNMSVGINLLLGLTEKVSAMLGDEYDIEILEMHHKHKVDAPSGTALALGAAAARGRKVALGSKKQLNREGARTSGDIGFAVLRGGDVAGDHTVMFAGPGERIELTHKASSRSIFARGAVMAALWVRGKPPGLYTMRDVLGL